MLDNYPLILLLLAGTAMSAIWLITQCKRLDMKWYVAILIAVLHTICGVMAVKVFAFLETGFKPDGLSKMSLFGGVFFLPVLYWLGARITKKPIKDVFDIMTPCMVMTLTCARVNCILSGCCKGAIIPGTEGMLWPTRQLEILFYLVLLVILMPRIAKAKTNGTAYPIYMAAYGIFRFIIEFLRASDSATIFHIAHLWAAISLIIGISICVEIKNNNTKEMGGYKRVKKHS